MNNGRKRFLWRSIFAFQRLISRVAPPFHSIHWKIFLLFLLVLLVPLIYVGWQLRNSIEKSYLFSAEEGMIDTAAVIVDIYSRVMAQQGDLPVLQKELGRACAQMESADAVKVRLFGPSGKGAATRVLAYDAQGHVIFDTHKELRDGANYSNRPDVKEALAGKYGARWELNPYEKRVYLFSTLPVFDHGRLVGAVTVSKPTHEIRYYVTHTLKQLLLPAIVTIAAGTLVAYLLSAYITRTLADLARRAERVASGEPDVRLETWTKSELGDMARAVERMRQKLEGKAYVEEMTTTFSHELKTPLAAIRGAAELLEDGAAENPATRAKFLGNIQNEVRRLDRLVNEMLRLARIETNPREDLAGADLYAVAREVAETYGERAASLGVQFVSEIPEGECCVTPTQSDLVLLLTNLLENAVQFTPAGKAVRLNVRDREAVIEDEGPGIDPDFLPKIFNRFFTTENPRTGARGTGLGLAIVRAIARRNQVEVGVESQPGKGSAFRLRFAE